MPVTRGERLAVRAKSDAVDFTLIFDRANGFAAAQIPEDDFLVLSAGRKRLAIWAKSHSPDFARVSGQGHHLTTACNIEKDDRPGFRAASQRLPIWSESDLQKCARADSPSLVRSKPPNVPKVDDT